MSGELNENWVKMRLASHLDGVKTRAANLTADHVAPRHVHQQYVFSLAVKGAWAMDCGHCRATHVFKGGDLLLTEAHEVYAGRTVGKPPWLNYSINISKEKLVSLLDFAADGKPIRLPHYAAGAVQNASLRRLFLALHDSVSDERTALEQESLLLDWIVSVGQNYAEQSDGFGNRRIYSESSAVRRVREFIRENVGENINLQTLARIARLSPFHLNRAFRAQIGLPPHEFQNQLRIEKAQNLIARKKSFSEIALETGFTDQSHFNRFFKRYTGITPKRFFTE